MTKIIVIRVKKKKNEMVKRDVSDSEIKMNENVLKNENKKYHKIKIKKKKINLRKDDDNMIRSSSFGGECILGKDPNLVVNSSNSEFVTSRTSDCKKIQKIKIKRKRKSVDDRSYGLSGCSSFVEGKSERLERIISVSNDNFTNEGSEGSKKQKKCGNIVIDSGSTNCWWKKKSQPLKKKEITEEDKLKVQINETIFKYNEKLINIFLEKSQGNSRISTYKKIFGSNECRLLLSLVKRKIPNSKTYLSRLAKEIQLISYFDFVLVFLQVSKILELAADIPHIIRGSAGSCLLCFLMKITDIDPIKENISLSRFMHKDRQSIPDIDIDFPAHIRDKIYKRIFDHWGDTVARISNHIMYKEKSALREAIRRKGYNKFIKRDFEIDEVFPDKKDQEEIEEIKKNLIGNFRCHSLHCGGIIILKDKIPNNLLLKNFEIEKDIFGKQIWMNKNQVEDANMIKIDILSNNGLSQLLEIDKKDIYDYDFNDHRIWDYLSKNNNNIGIIYAESRGMNKIFQTMKIKSLNDLATALALIRPSASKNGRKSGFLRDYTTIDFTNKDYKYLIFDDDATFYIKKILGCDEGTADNYRRAFSKNKMVEKKKFYKELYKSGKSKKEIETIKEKLDQLRYYGFCKSHAYSYARLIYVLAYNKYYNSKKFWVSTLNHASGSTYRRWVHFREAYQSGIKLQIGNRPFYLTKNNSLGGKNIISKLVYKDNYDFIYNGYWIGNNFLEGMYYQEYWSEYKKKNKDDRLIIQDKKVKMAKFRGIIACGRNFINYQNGKQKSKLTFITIGVDNQKYIDIVYYGLNKISKVKCVEGYGYVKMENGIKWIESFKFKPVFIKI